MAGKGGGAWKVAYADFVTAMMAFFMVMWLVGQKPDVKEAIAEHFREPYAPFWASTSHSGLPHQQSKRHHDEQNPAESSVLGHPDEHNLRRVRGIAVRGSERSGVGAIVYFAENSTELDAAGKQRLDAIVPLLEGKPQKIEIRGHTSRKPLPADSPFADIWQLCYLRCEAVRNYLIQRDIPPDRLRLSQAAGYEPFTSGLDAAQQARNQRVEVFLLTEVAEDVAGVTPGAGHSDAHDSHGDDHLSDGHGEDHAAKDDHGHGDKDAHGEKSAADEKTHAPKPKPKRPPPPPSKPPAAKPAAKGHGSSGHGGGHGSAKPAAKAHGGGGHGAAKPAAKAKPKGGH